MGGRIIKFRAWDKVARKIFPVYVLDLDKMAAILGKKQTALGYWTHALEFMQFTGLLDRQGKEIYEKDICKFSFSPDLYIITWDNDFGGFKMVDIRTKKDWGKKLMYECDVSDIIGNIYENPELLK